MKCTMPSVPATNTRSAPQALFEGAEERTWVIKTYHDRLLRMPILTTFLILRPAEPEVYAPLLPAPLGADSPC